MLIFLFSGEHVPFFLDLLMLSCIFKKLLYPSALFNKVWTLPMISELSRIYHHRGMRTHQIVATVELCFHLLTIVKKNNTILRVAGFLGLSPMLEKIDLSFKICVALLLKRNG